MPKRVIDIFWCWKGAYGKFSSFPAWCAIPLCIMWVLCHERNTRTFEREETSIMSLKSLFLFSSLDLIE